jgi:hypothetical protein
MGDPRYIASKTAIHVGTCTQNGLFPRLANQPLTAYNSVIKSYCDIGMVFQFGGCESRVLICDMGIHFVARVLILRRIWTIPQSIIVRHCLLFCLRLAARGKEVLGAKWAEASGCDVLVVGSPLLLFSGAAPAIQQAFVVVDGLVRFRSSCRRHAF